MPGWNRMWNPCAGRYVCFTEDSLRAASKTISENMNLLRKFALGMIGQYKSRTASGQASSMPMFA